MKRFRRLLAAIGVSKAPATSAEELPPPQLFPRIEFESGQVWRYTTRSGEEASRVHIGRIDRAPELGTIVHVMLTGLRLSNSSAPTGLSEVISHAPVPEAQLATSVLELTDEDADLEGFAEGYATWLSSYRPGDAGAFTISLSEIVEHMKQVLSQDRRARASRERPRIRRGLSVRVDALSRVGHCHESVLLPLP